jgi:hypothetical protein
MTRDRLLRDYANENSCLIYGPGKRSTFPYKPSATQEVI